MSHCKTGGWIGVVLLLAGCASNPMLQSSQAASTEAADAIVASLVDAQVSPAASEPVPVLLPSAVSQALLPPIPGAIFSSGVDERFDVHVRDMPANLFFQGLVEGSSYSVLVHPEVTGSVSLNLRKVTVPDVMGLLADMQGYELRREGNVYKVFPGGLQTRVFEVNYLNMVRKGGSETQVSSGQISASSDSGSSSSGGSSGDQAGGAGKTIGTRITTSTESDFWGQLDNTLALIIGAGEGRQVVTTPSAGIVVVRANSSELRAVEQYLERARLTMKRQVILEAKILEVTLNEGYQQGVDWSAVEVFSSNLDANNLPKKYVQGSLAGQALSSPELGGVFGASLRLSNFKALISLLGKQGNVQVLSSPRISTLNNQKAVIKVGSDEFFVTDIEFSENTSANTSGGNTTSSVQLTPFFSGISLDVTPQIGEDGVVTLHVHPAVSEVQDQTKVITVGAQNVTLPLALSTVRETDSIIRARDGQVVVIGGLIQNASEDKNASVPFLSDIPWIGELFKQRKSSSRKSELVILLRPQLTDNETWQQDISGSETRVRALREVLRSPDAPAPDAAP